MEDVETKQSSPVWWDESKLRKAYYADGYSGWIIDCGDGTCRYANMPLLGADFGFSRIDDNDPKSRLLTEDECKEKNRNRPHFGDRVRLRNGRPDPSEILERWEPEKYDPETGKLLR